MTHIQIELDNEEDEVIRTFMFLKGEDNKKIALKKLILYAKENISEIKDALKIKQKIVSKK